LVGRRFCRPETSRAAIAGSSAGSPRATAAPAIQAAITPGRAWSPGYGWSPEQVGGLPARAGAATASDAARVASSLLVNGEVVGALVATRALLADLHQHVV